MDMRRRSHPATPSAEETAQHTLLGAHTVFGTGIRHMKRIFGSCDGHIHQTPLLLQVVAVAGGTVWQQPFRTADHEHMLEFEAFCGVER